MTVSAARLTALLTPLIETTGGTLEDVEISRAGSRSVVRVLVDRDGGVSLDDVADVSRVISEALDELDEAEPTALGASYVLEVSSPGVERPLTAPRHWRRNISRLVTVVLRDTSTVTGRVRAVENEELVLEVDGQQQVLPFAEVVRGAVQVEFSRAGEEDA
ncbi:MAG: ribosome maturation factor RimP [Mycobacteriales bacterium]